MAKLKIKGFQEMLDVPQEQAKQVANMLSDNLIPRDEVINLGRVVIRKSDVIAIILEEQNKKTIFVGAEEYYKREDEILAMSPMERSLVNAWGHFSLFYQGIYKEKPDLSLKEKVIQKAVEFFEKNPEWTVPSMICWFELLNIPKEKKMDRAAFSILEIVEEAQLKRIIKNKEYKKFEENLEKKGEEISLKEIEEMSFEKEEIRLEDLPF